jgi:hypothetical protein
MAPPAQEKIQPWKAFPPSQARKEGYEYPETKKGKIMVLNSGSAACTEYQKPDGTTT